MELFKKLAMFIVADEILLFKGSKHFEQAIIAADQIKMLFPEVAQFGYNVLGTCKYRGKNQTQQRKRKNFKQVFGCLIKPYADHIP
jgi:hypothetical protein